jgi:hypothetical protein
MGSSLLRAFLLIALLSIGVRAEWNFGPKEQIDYRAPKRNYEKTTRGNAVVFLERELLNKDPALAQKALNRAMENRMAAIAFFPQPVRAELEEIPLYVMYGPKATGGGRANGARYFPKTAPDSHVWVDPDWRSVIVIHSAENYVKITDFWATKALVHELSHAHHLLHWPADQKEIVEAWQNAKNRGLYRNVTDEKGQFHEEAYPRVNALEYFAELSTMYFFGCNYAPHSRTELEAYDPWGARTVSKFWGP